MRIILDTDIGADCDDAAAIGLLMELEEQGKCFVEGITAVTTREGAPEAIEAIVSYYGKKKKIGRMYGPVLPCDDFDHYDAAMKARYGGTGSSTDSVELMRRILADVDAEADAETRPHADVDAEVQEKITLVAIGPLTNIAGLLKSPGDAISPLSGRELMESCVDCLYIMGGSFTQYDASGSPAGEDVMQEWNILQDIAGASYVMEHCPCEMVLCPFETGNRVFTTMRQGDNPVWYAMRCFAGDRITAEHPNFRRESWDPVTCLAAAEDCREYFSFSDRGRVTVEEDGTMNFQKDRTGNARFIRDKGHYEELGARIDSLLRD